MSDERVPKGYKNTEVGVIPEDWEVVLLDSVAKRGSGHTPDKKYPEYWNGNIKWISLKDSDLLDALYIDDTTDKTTPLGIANSSAVIHPAGTVILSRDAGVGKSSILSSEMAVSQHFIAWQCSLELDNHFLYYWLQIKKSEFERIAIGNTIKTIGFPYFKDFKIPFPPLPEQKAIATTLSNIDNLITALDKLIGKKRDIKTATMQQLLTGKKRLPGFGEEWKQINLGDIAEIISGGTPTTTNLSYWNGSIKWCIPTDITRCHNKYLFETERKISYLGLKNSGAQLLPAGTLLLCSRATIGEVKIAGCEISTNQGFKSIVCSDTIDNEFIYYKLLTMKQQMIERAFGSTFLEISKSNVTALELSIPPFPEQKAIATILSNQDEEITALEKRLAKTKAIKQGMMQELLTGKTRLINNG
ncbi:type I restriction modification DNA specificity domain protein [Lyngbya aestuarii BL J]|uniref:Type I restriction modification DNA specificity domain protein n=1 Tax=Lyngbya aestuarii BL J TaxID=1348334 RepID=U7QJL4_9CYAN|nr:restriction endonuclease subunit S [Lyngbya aestuarii]ERT07295.1 type I restriction modification DNA specificity domain protein [Lyngbya aestuarii BL J]